MQPITSFSAQNFSRSNAVPFDLVASDMLSFVMSFNRLIQEYFRNSPIKGAVREYYLSEQSIIESDYNFKHKRKLDTIATNFDRENQDLKRANQELFDEQKARAIHTAARSCWFEELDSRFKHKGYCPHFQFRRYQDAAPGESGYTFTEHRFFYPIWSQYDVQIEEEKNDILNRDCDYTLLQRGSRLPAHDDEEPHIRLFARTAQLFTHQKIDEYYQKIRKSFSGPFWGNMNLFKNDIEASTPDFRKVLLMNACSRLYYATSKLLLDGSLEKFKKPIQETESFPDGGRHRTFSARLDTKEGALKKQVDLLLEVFNMYAKIDQLQKDTQNFDVTTVVIQVEKLTISPDQLSQATVQFYKETKVFTAAIKDFVTLFEIHLEKDKDLFRAPSLSTSRSPRPTPRGSSLAGSQATRYEETLKKQIEAFSKVRELFEKIDSYCPNDIMIQSDGYI